MAVGCWLLVVSAYKLAALWGHKKAMAEHCRSEEVPGFDTRSTSFTLLFPASGCGMIVGLVDEIK